MSTHEEQREELDMAEAAYDAEAEEELVGQAASSEHYFALANRLFSEVHDAPDGSWTGNPSLSDFVSQYMKSLKRGKASTDCTPFLIRSYLFLISYARAGEISEREVWGYIDPNTNNNP
jgi:hypothetical protein